MADKTTTLKTKTGDNVYPNIKGENRKDSFVDSSTITHHFYDKTHKVGFQIANETNIKIQNSLQKPAGLTKTELVGVGTNGQENIEIGSSLNLENGELNINDKLINLYPYTLLNVDFDAKTYTGDFGDINYPVMILDSKTKQLSLVSQTISIEGNTKFVICSNLVGPAVEMYRLKNGQVQDYTVQSLVTMDLMEQEFIPYIQMKTYYHFITLTSNTSTFYLTYQNTSNEKLNTLDSLKTALAGKYLLCTGHTDSEKAEYISGERGNIVVGVVDNSDNSTSGITIDSSFTITDLVTPV